LLSGRKKAGAKVAIIGAGGIGFDVAEFLVQEGEKPDIGVYLKAWGVDETTGSHGGLQTSPERPKPSRTVFLCQRKSDRMGASLGKTTGWVHRATLKAHKVKMIGGVTYDRIDDQGLWIREGKPGAQGEPRCLEVDSIINCSGQLSQRELVESLKAAGKPVHLIGGADLATELDAKRAIRQGAELAAII
jgi:2,4-dienoyl-CoA reductase (NADPH2)